MMVLVESDGSQREYHYYYLKNILWKFLRIRVPFENFLKNRDFFFKSLRVFVWKVEIGSVQSSWTWGIWCEAIVTTSRSVFFFFLLQLRWCAGMEWVEEAMGSLKSVLKRKLPGLDGCESGGWWWWCGGDTRSELLWSSSSYHSAGALLACRTKRVDGSHSTRRRAALFGEEKVPSSRSDGT